MLLAGRASGSWVHGCCEPTYEELKRIKRGGYFQSIKTAEVAIYVTVSSIKKNKWKETLTLVKSALYELKQIFVKKFYEQTQFY